MRHTLVAIVILLGAFTCAALAPQLSAEMAMNLHSESTTKELVALAFRIDSRIGSPQDVRGSRFRRVGDLDGVIYTIRIKGEPIAEDVSKYTAELEILPPTTDRLVGGDIISTKSGVVRARLDSVWEEAWEILDWATAEIRAFQGKDDD